MVNGTPLPKSDDLFNRLSDIQIEDVDIARQIAAEAMLLNKQRPGDFTTKIALAESLLFSGRRAAAIEQLVGAFSIRDRGDYAVMDRLAMMLMFAADREKAIRVIEDIAFQPGMFDSGMLGNNHALIASWAVDLDLLHRLIARDKRANAVGAAQHYGRLFAEFGQIEDLALHQRTLIEVVRDVQIAVCFVDASDASGTMTFVNNIVFDASSISRRELEQKAESAIEYKLGSRLDGYVLNVFTASPAHSGSGSLRIVGRGGVASVHASASV